jgi:hypothetical protein
MPQPSIVHPAACSCCDDMLRGQFDRRRFIQIAGSVGLIAAFPSRIFAAEGDYEAPVFQRIAANADEWTVDADLSDLRRAAEAVAERIRNLRKKFELTPFEYTKRIRIAPEIPHSHPVLTLGTQYSDDDALLSGYLHEQMHWYLSLLHSPDFMPLISELKAKYPSAPPKLPEGANDAFSTHLHLVVNWLEIETASTFLGRDRAIAVVLAKPYYRWIYRTVVADWDALGDLYRQKGWVPIKPASAFAN